MDLVHRRMDELTAGWLIAHDEPAVGVPLEKIGHGHTGAALLQVKRGVSLSFITVNAHGIDADVHHGHVDAVIVAEVVLDGGADRVGVAAGCGLRRDSRRGRWRLAHRIAGSCSDARLRGLVVLSSRLIEIAARRAVIKMRVLMRTSFPKCDVPSPVILQQASASPLPGPAFCSGALPACLRSHVAHAELHADLLEECVGRLAAGEDPDVIVGNFLRRAVDIENDRVRFELHGRGIEHDFDFALAHAICNALRVAFLDAA